MDLVLIRHPAPAVETGICYGRTDVPLAADERASADAIIARLAALDAPLPQAMWTSPLVRCAGVAARLARRFGCMERADARLQEIDFGAWERLRWDAIDRAALDAWAADLWHARVHGGESVAQFGARIGEWFGAWIRANQVAASASTHVVTHAGVMRMLTSLALGLPIEDMLHWPVSMAGIVWLRGAPNGGAWRVIRWNA
ncbi:histidine phosphatase family protein [Trinickia sp. LjRoot230]|uniref:histidine phosphatase family protein n=1 Tax=Trinickia sp. LjRoot230 TaxID=3342288 RepID=UPI003ECFE465